MTNNLWSFWPYWVFWPSIAVCLEIWWGLHSRIYCNVQCHQKLSAQSIPGFHRVIIMTTLLQQAGFLTWVMPRLRFFTWSLPAAGSWGHLWMRTRQYSDPAVVHWFWTSYGYCTLHAGHHMSRTLPSLSSVYLIHHGPPSAFGQCGLAS